MFGFGGLLPVLTILLAGLLTTTIGSIIRDRYTNWVKMARTQKVMAAWRKEQMEAMRKGQQTRLSQLKEAQQGFMKDSMEVQTAPMKSMAWTMFMFIVIFTWLRLFVAAGTRFRAMAKQRGLNLEAFGRAAEHDPSIDRALDKAVLTEIRAHVAEGRDVVVDGRVQAYLLATEKIPSLKVLIDAPLAV